MRTTCGASSRALIAFAGSAVSLGPLTAPPASAHVRLESDNPAPEQTAVVTFRVAGRWCHDPRRSRGRRHSAVSAAIMKHLVAIVVLMLGFAAGTLGSAGVASAHAARIAADPVEDASLTEPPPRVSAMFNEAMQPQFAAMTVVGPDGNLWSTGDPMVDGAVISVGVRPLGPAGTYTVNYRATSADGHVVSGSWSFQLTVAGTATSGAAAATPAPPAAGAADTSEKTSGIPVWPFFLGAVAIIGAGVLWAARRRT